MSPDRAQPLLDTLRREGEAHGFRQTLGGKREAELRTDYQVGKQAPDELARILVTVFQELRNGATTDGKTKVKTPASVLSTAEAISVLFNAGILAQGFGTDAVTADDIARSLAGALTKDGPEDLKALREYAETVCKVRPGAWKELATSMSKRL